MEHTTYTEKIALWLDDELLPAEVIELQTHLAECQACTRTYQAMQQLEQMLRSAATVIAEPAPGFTGRVQTRLAYASPRRRWRMWAGLSVLLVSSMTMLAAGLIIGGLALLSTWANLIDSQLIYYWLGTFGETINQIRALVILGGLILRVLWITGSQPAFWVLVPVTGALAWLWVYLLKNPIQRLSTTVDMLV